MRPLPTLNDHETRRSTPNQSCASSDSHFEPRNVPSRSSSLAIGRAHSSSRASGKLGRECIAAPAHFFFPRIDRANGLRASQPDQHLVNNLADRSKHHQCLSSVRPACDRNSHRKAVADVRNFTGKLRNV